MVLCCVLIARTTNNRAVPLYAHLYSENLEFFIARYYCLYRGRPPAMLIEFMLKFGLQCSLSLNFRLKLKTGNFKYFENWKFENASFFIFVFISFFRYYFVFDEKRVLF